jgi:formylglycine-generating enzyme required for sulfatase activity
MLTELVELPAGSFRMGSTSFYPEEAPVHTVRVAAFAIERHPVTNARFAEFVDETGYVTVAEQQMDPALYPGPTLPIWCPVRSCSPPAGRWTCGTGGSGGTGRQAPAGVIRSARQRAWNHLG